MIRTFNRRNRESPHQHCSGCNVDISPYTDRRCKIDTSYCRGVIGKWFDTSNAGGGGYMAMIWTLNGRKLNNCNCSVWWIPSHYGVLQYNQQPSMWKKRLQPSWYTCWRPCAPTMSRPSAMLTMLSPCNAVELFEGGIFLSPLWSLSRVLIMKMPLLISTILYRNDPQVTLYTMVCCPGMIDTVNFV